MKNGRVVRIDEVPFSWLKLETVDKQIMKSEEKKDN